MCQPSRTTHTATVNKYPVTLTEQDSTDNNNQGRDACRGFKSRSGHQEKPVPVKGSIDCNGSPCAMRVSDIHKNEKQTRPMVNVCVSKLDNVFDGPVSCILVNCHNQRHRLKGRRMQKSSSKCLSYVFSISLNDAERPSNENVLDYSCWAFSSEIFP